MSDRHDWMAGMTDFQRAEVARLESRIVSFEKRWQSLEADWNDCKKALATAMAELAAAIKQRDEARGQTLYLLYDGTSVDGSGQGYYIGRTTDKEVARNHHAKCRKNPYSIGFVEIVTDTEKKRVSYYGTELQPKKQGGGA